MITFGAYAFLVFRSILMGTNIFDQLIVAKFEAEFTINGPNR